MRPIPAPRIGDSHGLLRAIDERERVRLDEFVTEFSVEDLFPPELENAIGRTRQFVSFARAAGLLKEDHGTVELTEIGRRYIRAGDAEHPFHVSPSQAEWLRRQLREKHMTDSIFHGLAIGLSLLASAPGAHISTLDFGRALGYLGRAGWDNENTLEGQGERHVTLLRDMELLDEERRLTPTGTQVKSELTLPIHMSLPDIAAQLNPGGADAVREAGEKEWAAAAAPPEPAEAPADSAASAPAALQGEDEYADVGPGSWAEVPAEPAAAEPSPPEPAAPAGPPVPPPDIWETAAPDEATRAYSAVPPPSAADEAPAGEDRGAAAPDEAAAGEAGGPPTGDEAVVGGDAAGGGDAAAADEAVWGGDGDEVASGGGVAGSVAANGAGEVGTAPAAPELPAPEPVAPEPDPADAATVISTPPQSAPVEPPPPPPAPAPAPAVGAASAAVVPPAPAPSRPPAFVGADAIGVAAAEQGLRMDEGVYANVAAALATGRHVVLVGPPGSGRTTLALAVAKAAVEAGKADGAELVGAAATEQILAAARRNRWLVIDGLVLDDSLAPLSAFLSHVPVTREDGEVAAPGTWRIVATAAEAPRGALSTRFAAVEIAPHEDLEAAINEAAGGDQVAAAAVRRLLPLRDTAPLGAGPYLAAARHAAERRAAAPADEATLAREALTAYLAPLLDEQALARARDLL